MRRIPAETILIGELVIGNDNKMNIVWQRVLLREEFFGALIELRWRPWIH